MKYLSKDDDCCSNTEASEPYWDSYYLGSESIIESILDKVFKD